MRSILRSKRFLARVLACAGALGSAFIGWQVWTPETVAWTRTTLGDFSVERADGLVLQDSHGQNLYATIGYTIYRSRAGSAFERVHEIVPPFGEPWAGYLRGVRDLLRQQEMAEVVALEDDVLVVFAGGEVHRVDLAKDKDEIVHTMRYWGRGKGRGLMPHGVTVDGDGTVFYGEYPTGHDAAGGSVRLWSSRDGGRSFQVAHEFAPGFARHIHSVQWDPQGHALWVATGDSDAESHIGYSTDGGASFRWIGSGSQAFRACSLMFASDRVEWAMDSPSVPSYIMTWERSSGSIAATKPALPSPGYYTRSLGEKGALFTLAERRAAVWLVDAAGPRELFDWPVTADASRPHPSVRLLRSYAEAETAGILLNPLRTDAESAAIYRIASTIDIASTPRTVAMRQ